MRAYLAILKDSFREAMASRVLLIALAGIVIVLLLLSPFGLSTDKATELRRSELTWPERLLSALSAGAEEERTPQSHLWSLLDSGQRKQVDRWLNPAAGDPPPRDRGPGGNRLKRELVKQLNNLLEHPDFYDAECWTDADLPEEATELLTRGDLTADEQKRRNLLLLAAAFPREITISDSSAISLYYANATVIGPIPLTPTEFEPIFERIVQAVVGVFLGFLGIFGALLVTAGLIPRMFEPGEISLLLSKPVSRPLLFLTRFLGGCTFTLLYATVLVSGICILLAARMNYAAPQLLWCIPVYVFLFMIYYAVSAVAGAIWRNSIVALVLVILFWVGLTVIGATDQILRENLIRQRGIKEITVAGSELVTVDGNQNTYLWNAEASTWQPVFEPIPGTGLPAFARAFLGAGVRFVPVYDELRDRILALQWSASRFGGLGSPELVAGTAADGWERVPLGRVPDVAVAVLVSSAGRVLLPCVDKIYEYTGQTEQERRRSDFLGNITGGLLGGASNGFREVQPAEMPDLGTEAAAAIVPDTDDLLLYGDGVLHRLVSAENGQYTLAASRDLETSGAAVLAVGKQSGIIALGDGRIIIFDHDSLETVQENRRETGGLPRMCAAAGDGTGLAVLTGDQEILLFDGQTGAPAQRPSAAGGEYAALAFAADGSLLVSDGRLAVEEFSLSSGDRIREWSESTTWVYQLYDYGVHPLWNLLPKPAQLDSFVGYILRDRRSGSTEPTNGTGSILRRNARQQTDQFDPMNVLITNAIFIAVMLGAGCLYVSRSDF